MAAIYDVNVILKLIVNQPVETTNTSGRKGSA